MQTIVVVGHQRADQSWPGLDKAHMVDLVRQCAQLKQQGHRIIIVTSGAIAAGRELLGRQPGTETLAQKQMLAAIGQSQLLHTWQSLFALYSIVVGQMLLTQADLENRERYLNARDALRWLYCKRERYPSSMRTMPSQPHKLKWATMITSPLR